MSGSAIPSSDAFDFIVLGSGFGGSVSALRLAEKGYSVLVVEEGKRWRSQDFPRSNWNLRKSQWQPWLGCYGTSRIDWLGDVLVLGGAGVGGGSLVYANTLVEPSPEAFSQGWPLPDMRARLDPHYLTARRMLGATRPPTLGPAEEHLRSFARSLGRDEYFGQPDVGILFGDKPGEQVPDPYFGGEGPPRATCQLCGGCMVGCRHDAKNTLDKNYLYLAERLGAQILPETRAFSIAPDDQGGYVIRVRPSLGWRRKARQLRARQVVVACGALGTTDLLLACKERGTLPNLSSALGRFTRTNSEIICGARSRTAVVDHSHGIAIASNLQADDATHIQIVRYPAGSDLMGLLGTLAVEGGGKVPRVLRWVLSIFRHPFDLVRNLWPFAWAKRAVIVLVMQSLDNALTLVRARWNVFGRGLRSKREHGAPPIPSYLPIANQAARHVARSMGGFALNAVNEVVLGVPITAHILGGARMAEEATAGVVDSRCRVFGHPGLWVIDGSVIPSNLGANPSLTITAVAEYAMSFIPEKRP